MKRTLFTFILVFGFLLGALTSSSEADDIWRSGSIYSQFGLGLPYDYQSSYSDAMGIHGTAVFDTRQPSIANPATWSRSMMTNIGGVLEFSSQEATFDGIETNSSNFQAGPLQLNIPIVRERIGFNLSISPVTSARYVTESQELTVDGTGIATEDNQLRYKVKNFGSGGINRIEAGVGIRLTNEISIGYAPSLLLGVIRRNQDIGFNDPGHRIVNLNEKTSHYGFGHRFGLYMHRASAFRQNDRIALGATFSLPVNFVSERELISQIGASDITVNPKSYYGDGDVTFPLEASAGVSYNINPYFLMSADALYQNWDGYTNFDGDSEPFLKDRLKMGIGTQYIAARRDLDTFFSRFIYRLGLSYDNGSLKLDDGQNINTLSLHAGIGIPSSRTASSININAEYGFRGIDDNNLVSERIFAIKVSFNLSELMFIQRRLQ